MIDQKILWSMRKSTLEVAIDAAVATLKKSDNELQKLGDLTREDIEVMLSELKAELATRA